MLSHSDKQKIQSLSCDMVSDTHHVSQLPGRFKPILKLLAPSFEHLRPLRRYPIPRGTQSAGALNTRGWVGKIGYFRRKLPFI